MSKTEPTDEQVRQAAVTATKIEVAWRNPPGNARDKGQSHFWKDLKSYGDREHKHPFTPQLISKICKTDNAGSDYAQFLREYYDLTRGEFVERFGRLPVGLIDYLNNSATFRRSPAVAYVMSHNNGEILRRGLDWTEDQWGAHLNKIKATLPPPRPTMPPRKAK